MKKFITLIVTLIMSLACVFGLSACQSSNMQTLTVYTESGFAPFEYLNEDGEVVGADMDVMKEVCDILGYKLVIKDVAFGSIFTNVQNDEMAVGAAGITVNAEREETGIFTKKYTTSTQYVIVANGTFTSADLVDGKLPIEKLVGKKIGVQESTTGCWLIADEVDGTEDDDGNPIVGCLQDNNTFYYEYKNAVIAAADMGTKIDAVVIDKLPAESICDGNSNLVCYQLEGEPESYAFYLNKNATELKAKIDNVLDTLINNGFVDYLINKHCGAYSVSD